MMERFGGLVGAGAKEMISGITPTRLKGNRGSMLLQSQRYHQSTCGSVQLSTEAAGRSNRVAFATLMKHRLLLLCSEERSGCCDTTVADTTSSPIFRVQLIPFCEINGDLGR